MIRIYLICVLLSLLLFIACEEGADHTVTLKFPPPKLACSPDTLYFTLPGDALLPGMHVSKSVRIWNAGAGSFDWSLSANRNWMALSATSGTCDGEVVEIEVLALFDQIDDGQVRSGSITVTAGDETATIHAIAANYIECQICAADSSFEFTADIDPGPKILQVRACGNWESEWTAVSNTPWVEVSPGTGFSSGEWKDFSISINWGLVPELQPALGSVTLDGPNDIEIEIQAFPNPPELLCVDREDRYMLVQDSNPGPVTFSLARCDPGAAVDWIVIANKPWVQLTPSSGSSSGEWDAVDLGIDWGHDWVDETDFSSKIRITGGGVTDSFIVSITPNCRILFREPTAVTQWTAGDWVTIRWKNIQVPCCHVNLYLYKGTRPVVDLGWGPLEPLVDNYGELEWVVTTAGSASGSDYRFRIIPNDGLITYDGCAEYSDYFTITVPDNYVQVYEPNKFVRVGYYPGSTCAIRWMTNLLGANVSIDLYREGAFVRNIIPLTANDGSFDWVVEAVEEGTFRYYVKVTDADDPACGGFSDWFNILN